MKLSLSCLVLASCFAAATCAHASSLTGTIYTGVTPQDGTFVYAGAPIPTHTGSADFTVTGAGINYASGPSAYTPAGFLNHPGFSNKTGTFTGTEDLNQSEVVITGSLSVMAGDVLTISHDDGVILYLNGSNTAAINSPGPTGSGFDTYNVTSTGLDTFVLYYAETGGRPALLDFTDTSNGVTTVVGATPEPSSLMLLGTGIAAAAGMVRRRYARSV